MAAEVPKTVTIVFCDVVGSTKLGELDLGEVRGLAGGPGEEEAIHEALVLYERKGNLVSAARASARLAELAS